MSTTFRPYAPDQMLLLPADLRAWLPEGHLAHHVSDLVDGVDLTAFYAPYAGDGRRNAPNRPTPPSIEPSSSACDSTSRPSTTSHDGLLAAGPNAISSGASNASSPARSTNASWTDFRTRQAVTQAA